MPRTCTGCPCERFTQECRICGNLLSQVQTCSVSNGTGAVKNKQKKELNHERKTSGASGRYDPQGRYCPGFSRVLIGAPTGVACSVCPGGATPKYGPVNPLLGAKVLPGETDLALPGPLPFILSRAYSSYRTKDLRAGGVFGPGWKAPSISAYRFAMGH